MYSMYKVYKQKMIAKLFMSFFLLLSTYQLFFANVHLIVRIVCFLAILLGTLGVYIAKIIVSDEGICRDAGFLTKRVELKWEEIVLINHDSLLGMHIYFIVSKNPKKKINIPWSITNHKDLVAEVIKKSNKAKIPDSVKHQLNI